MYDNCDYRKMARYQSVAPLRDYVDFVGYSYDVKTVTLECFEKTRSFLNESDIDYWSFVIICIIHKKFWTLEKVKSVTNDFIHLSTKLAILDETKRGRAISPDEVDLLKVNEEMREHLKFLCQTERLNNEGWKYGSDERFPLQKRPEAIELFFDQIKKAIFLQAKAVKKNSSCSNETNKIPTDLHKKRLFGLLSFFLKQRKYRANKKIKPRTLKMPSIEEESDMKDMDVEKSIFQPFSFSTSCNAGSSSSIADGSEKLQIMPPANSESNSQQIEAPIKHPSARPEQIDQCAVSQAANPLCSPPPNLVSNTVDIADTVNDHSSVQNLEINVDELSDSCELVPYDLSPTEFLCDALEDDLSIDNDESDEFCPNGDYLVKSSLASKAEKPSENFKCATNKADSSLKNMDAPPINNFTSKLPELVVETVNTLPVSCSSMSENCNELSLSVTNVESNDTDEIKALGSPLLAVNWFDDVEENLMETLIFLITPRENLSFESDQERTLVQSVQCLDNVVDAPVLQSETDINSEESFSSCSEESFKQEELIEQADLQKTDGLQNVGGSKHNRTKKKHTWVPRKNSCKTDITLGFKNKQMLNSPTVFYPENENFANAMRLNISQPPLPELSPRVDVEKWSNKDQTPPFFSQPSWYPLNVANISTGLEQTLESPFKFPKIAEKNLTIQHAIGNIPKHHNDVFDAVGRNQYARLGILDVFDYNKEPKREKQYLHKKPDGSLVYLEGSQEVSQPIPIAPKIEIDRIEVQPKVYVECSKFGSSSYASSVRNGLKSGKPCNIAALKELWRNEIEAVERNWRTVRQMSEFHIEHSSLL